MSLVMILVGVFFLAFSLALFWLSRVLEASLLDDAALTLVFSLTALGLAQVIAGGLSRSLALVTLLGAWP
ncbi:MAG: hypothetical protein JRI59_03500 [Deltaproteobacteria bacterium]|nr:hypothetical protein [Deltaproteobacteria bacterium]